MLFPHGLHQQAQALSRVGLDLLISSLLRTIAVMHDSKTRQQLAEYPIAPKYVFRVMAVLIVLLALLAGYYQGRLTIWRDNNIKILEKFEVNTTKELLEKDVEVK